MKRGLIVIPVLMLAMLACQVANLAPRVDTNPTPYVVASVAAPVHVETNQAVPEDGSLSALYAQVIPGVVSIQTDLGSGSGFVFDSSGHIVTNQHVVEGASAVEVDFSSGYKAHGTVIGTDTDADLAVIQVNVPADQLQPLAIGDSNSLQVGQSVVAIGNPFGLNGTMTLGIISGLGRTQPAHAAPDGVGNFLNADVIQTDAAINPGNSGGPLFNLNGEVVGINQSIRTSNVDQTTGNAVNSGVGFSISINLVKRVVPFLIDNGKYEYPYLGLSSAELSLDQIEALNLNTYTGAYVTGVVPGGPADKAGVKGGATPSSDNTLPAGGDVIVAVDGHPINTFDQLLSFLVTNKSPGENIVLTVLRDGQTLDIDVTLGTRP